MNASKREVVVREHQVRAIVKALLPDLRAARAYSSAKMLRALVAQAVLGWAAHLDETEVVITPAALFEGES